MAAKPATPRSRVARDSLSLFSSTIGSSLLQFVFVLLVARVGGPSGRGTLAFLIAVPTLLHFAGTLGLETANLYFSGSRPGWRPALTTNSLLLGFASGSVLAALAWIVFESFPGLVPDTLDGGLLGLVLITTPFMTVQYLLVSALVGFGRVGSANVVRLAMPAIALGFFAVATMLGEGDDVRPAVIGWVIGQIAGATLAAAAAIATSGIEAIAAASRRSTELLRYGLSAHAGNLAVIAMFRVDTLILAATRSPHDVGLYAVAVNVAEVVLYLPTAVANVILPAGAARGGVAATELFRRAIRLTTGIAILSAAVGAAAAPTIVRTFFGEGFADSAGPLRLLLVAVVGMSIRQISWSGMAARRRQGIASVAAVLSLLLIVILDLALIPDHGPGGAAWASLLAYWAGGAGLLYLFLRSGPGAGPTGVAGLRKDLDAARQSLLYRDGRRPPSDPPPTV